MELDPVQGVRLSSLELGTNFGTKFAPRDRPLGLSEIGYIRPMRNESLIAETGPELAVAIDDARVIVFGPGRG
jgi:hypothetical protein